MMVIRRTNFNALWLIVVSIAMAGCGRGETLGKVFGQVTSAGQPVSEGLVVFSNPEKGVHITADLTANGSYELQTAGGFGLPLGSYQVAVNPPLVEPWMPGMPGEPPSPKTYDHIPPKYLRCETSGLTVTVGEGENQFDIDMQPE